ncbi:MAG: hypothetical protein KDA78_13600, partial [Planctomycetaceae bacterium]|nr:hypothetical protein [Planctomycetaceae bacterium]
INSPTPQEYGTFRFASQPFAGAGPSHNPSKWPLYSGKWELQVSDRSRNVSAANGNNYEEHELMRTTTGVIAWCQTYSQYADFENDPTTTTYGVLQSKNHAGQENLYLVDEPGEINVEPAFRNNASDGLFSIAETQFLHFSDGDWGRVKATFSSRLQKLVEYNFDRDTDPYDLGGTAYDDGAVLRSQFTTESWDRWEFSFAPALGADFSDVTTHDDGGYGSTNYSQTRGWEFNPVNNDVTRLAFPPEFVGAKRYTVNDPFRPETRQWLTVELNRDVTYSNFALPQQKLNLNRLLDKDPTGQFRQRQLTPHPVFENGLDSDDNNILNLMYGTGTSVVKLYGNGNPLPAQVFFEKMQNDKFVQEWWAKYDRQRLARDIYCLLYVLGNGNDRADPTYQNTGSSNRNDPYPVIVGETDNEDTDLDGNPDGDGVNDNLQAMAQFAVNYVDALDRDSVITEFVYDTDLSDGWDIDGAKVTSSGDFQDTSGETRSVFGVEMQQLTFSETFWVNIQSEPMDSMKTRWDDNSAIQFLFMELRNACPFDVSTINNTWRIRRIIGNDDGDPTVSESDDPTITFTRTEGADTFQDDVRPGALFRVQLHNGGAGHDAHLYLDADGSMTIEPGELICPSFNEGSLDDRNYIDLNKPGHNSEFSGNAANFFAAIPNDKFEIVLERRANMQGDSLLNNSREDVNPWVRVDYMQCVRDGDVDLLDDTTGDFRSDAFQDHYSIERREPFARFPRSNGTDTNEHTGSSVAPYRNHSMGPETPAADDHPYVEKNSNCPEVNSTATFTLWQPHFDRDFTSVFDLLSIPIVGPDQLTEKLAEGGQMSGKNTAFTKFAIPDPGTRNSANGDNEKVDNNRWYRLLGLVEIPTGAQQVLRDSLINLRTPGKINLNTIRHPGVLAALIDDDFHLDTFRQPRDVVVDSDAVKATYAWLQLREPVELPNGATISREPNRHWYEQFMFSRDRRDPYTGLTLPGIPGSRPFRPFHYTNIYSGADANLYRDSVASVEHTMLRSLPIFNGAGLGENLDAQGVPGLDSGSGWGTRTVTDANIETGIDEAVQRRRLFEARTSRDQGGVFPGGSPVNAVDFHTRHRLLSKISNNSTIRSNVFYCWIHVQFHEAAEDDFGNVQIGGQLNPSTHPAQRAFFIIDRSKMEEAWDPRTQTFDWRKMVTFSQILD